MALSVFDRASRRMAVGLGSVSIKQVSVLVGEEGGWRLIPLPILELALMGVPADDPDPELGRP